MIRKFWFLYKKSLSGVSSLFEGSYHNRDKNENVLLRGHFIKNPITESGDTINAGIF